MNAKEVDKNETKSLPNVADYFNIIQEAEKQKDRGLKKPTEAVVKAKEVQEDLLHKTITVLTWNTTSMTIQGLLLKVE